MFGDLGSVAEELRAVVKALEPGRLSGAQAAEAVKLFAEVKRLAGAAEALCAGRVEETEAWRASGQHSAAGWLSTTTGAGFGAAAGALETARRLDALPATRDAFVDGRLSENQVRDIAEAATADPSAESGLLDAAAKSTPSQLKDRCDRVKAAALADREGDGAERLRRRRSLRHWTDREGFFRIDGRLTPEDGAVVAATLGARVEKIFAEARRAGRREPVEAYRADALVDVCRNPGGVKGTVQVRVDHGALVRGHLEPGEVCEVPGVGPIPVGAARQLAGDGFVKAIVMDGASVVAVSHLGRTIHARVRTALEARDTECVVPGCGVGHGLEIDHIVPFAAGGPTTLANLCRLCRYHHGQKTHRGYRLTGGPGHWEWTPPDRPPPEPDRDRLFTDTG